MPRTALTVAECKPIVANNEKEFLDFLKTDSFDLLIYAIEYHDLVLRVSRQNKKIPHILLSQTKIRDLGEIFNRNGSANILAKGMQTAPSTLGI